MWQHSRHWVFDMDGTLTLAVHDFEAIKRALDIPLADDILQHLADLPSGQAAAKHAWLLSHERQLAEAAQAAPGAVELVRELQRRGRDEAPPKPDPGGLLHLAQQWQVAPSALVMVGDYRFDLECARAAGAQALLVNLPDNPWPQLCDGYAQDCHDLLAELRLA
jgi:phosphoglycolate phosphatase-like HAD superfamily hydrolase